MVNAGKYLRFAFSDGDSPPEPESAGLALMLRKYIIGSFLVPVNDENSYQYVKVR